MEAPTFSTPKSDDPQQGWIIASVRIPEGHGRFLGKHPDPKVKAGTDYGKTMEKQPWKHRLASPSPLDPRTVQIAPFGLWGRYRLNSSRIKF